MLWPDRVRAGRMGGTVQFLLRVQPFVALALAPQFLDFIQRANPTASAQRNAIQSRCRAAKFKYCWKCVAAQQGIGQAGVENVAGTGGVHGVHAEGRAVMELSAIPCQDATAAERGPSDAAAEAPSDLGQRL